MRPESNASADSLVVLIEAPDHVCYRYRFLPYRPALERLGLRVEVWPIARGLYQRWRQFRQLRAARGVFLQRKLFSPWELAVLRRCCRCLIYDVDDAVFRRDSFHRKGASSWYRRLRFALTVRAADVVIAGNRFLAAHVKRFQEAKSTSDRTKRTIDCQDPELSGCKEPLPPCVIVPTCVDPSLYPLAKHENSDGPVRLVWIGSAATLPSLERASPYFQKIAAVLPDVILRVVCDRLPGLSGIAMELWPWSRQTEAFSLASATIGVAWMPPDGWSRGKCGLKLLQYMAAGLPVLANPVGVHREMVIPNQTGELAVDEAQWAVVAERWARSPDLRRTLGQRGRKFVEHCYSTQRWEPVITRLIVTALQINTRELRWSPEAEAPVHPLQLSPHAVNENFCAQILIDMP